MLSPQSKMPVECFDEVFRKGPNQPLPAEGGANEGLHVKVSEDVQSRKRLQSEIEHDQVNGPHLVSRCKDKTMIHLCD